MNDKCLFRFISDPERTEEENEEFERKRKLRATKRKQQMVQQIEDTKVMYSFLL